LTRELATSRTSPTRSRSASTATCGDDPTLTTAEPDLYVLINAGWQDLIFRIQERGTVWRRVVDTARESPDDWVPPDERVPVAAPDVLVKARSVVVLEASPPAG